MTNANASQPLTVSGALALARWLMNTNKDSSTGPAPSLRAGMVEPELLVEAMLALREAERLPMGHHVVDSLTEDVAELWEACGPWDPRSADVIHVAVALMEAFHRKGENIEDVHRALGPE